MDIIDILLNAAVCISSNIPAVGYHRDGLVSLLGLCGPRSHVSQVMLLVPEVYGDECGRRVAAAPRLPPRIPGPDTGSDEIADLTNAAVITVDCGIHSAALTPLIT